jgi:signal transduction histidine kinase
MESETHFASPERSSSEELKHNYELLDNEKMFLDVFGAISGIAALIDNNRQIVYGNSELLDLLGLSSLEPILGKRPGEAVSCIHSAETANGCGTSEACRVCGAVNAILTSQQTGQKSTIETRITSEIGGKQISWDLKVTSAPLKIKDRQYFVFTLQDISSEKRKENLERIFFHDLLNSAGSLNGLLTILKAGTDPEEALEIIDMSEEVSRDLVEEILLHRQLRSAENGDLTIKIQLISPLELLKSVIGKIEGHVVAKGKRIILVDNSSNDDLETDKTIIQRVLINMLKNALEATENGGTVYAGVSTFDDKVRFQVKNASVMPRDIQIKVFQRSFSTKGNGRGVGTYSIKLLTENYLKGKAGFTSSEPEGTVFFVDLPRIK